MARRKLGASVIILFIAAITLISGTYAWFLVGGFASLFDIGFDVIEAQGGLLLQGSNGTAEEGADDWGTVLGRVDFVEKSFIVEGGKYKPVSSRDGETFVSVQLKDGSFVSDGYAPSKDDADVSAAQICYNDFDFKIKSDAEEIVGDETSGAYVQIELNGDSFDADGNIETDEEDPLGAAVAARVAITVDGVTRVYSVDGQTYQAVTLPFGSEIADVDDPDLGEGNRIIDAGEDTASAAGLRAPDSYDRLADENEVLTKIYLGSIPANSSAGKDVSIQVWLEGNDPDCVDFADNTVAGKSLMAKITFGIDE
ncbi:MAG: hypothetical protein IJB86_02605 [Clostridia bacterium]|nr:hypothetical protein [Clostridia bacterium]